MTGTVEVIAGRKKAGATFALKKSLKNWLNKH